MAYYSHYAFSPDAYKQAPAFRRYQIQEKISSFGDSFKIKDDVGRDIYDVHTKLFSIGETLFLQDMAGNGLIKIHEEVMHLHPTYVIRSARAGDADRPLATAKRKFSFFHHRFNIDSVFGQYSLEAVDVFAHSFTLAKNGQTVAVVSKKFFSPSDTYGVEVVGTEDQAFILSLAIVLDRAIFDKHGVSA